MNDIGDKIAPLIPGTDISIYRVAALGDGGYTMDQIRYELPSLTEDQVRGALQQATAMPPPPGVEYPRAGFKHLLKELSCALGDIERGETLLAVEYGPLVNLET